MPPSIKKGPKIEEATVEVPIKTESSEFLIRFL